jgi:hypothetical protein
MGTVYKETFTKPLPGGARIIVRKGRQLAEWKDAKGKTRTTPLTAAGDRIAVEVGTYIAEYRDGSGIRSGAEDAVADHRLTPLAGHVADYFAHQTARQWAMGDSNCPL